MENTAIKLVEQINELKDKDTQTRDAVHKQEKAQNQEYSTIKREALMLNKKEQEKQKQEKLAERAKKEFSKTGKHDAFRSAPIKIHKPKEEKVVDERTKDYQTYLSDISHLLLAE